MKVVSAFVIALALPLTAPAAEVICDPLADAPIWAGSPNENFGSRIDGYWGYYNGGQRTLVKWYPYLVTGTVTACKIRFQVTINNWHQSGNMLQMYRLLGSWDEHTVTYNTQPCYDSTTNGMLFNIIPPTGTGVFTYNCTTYANAIVQGWVDTPYTNCGVLMITNPENSGVGTAFPYMKEGYPAYTPVQLIITYTPGGSGIAPASLGRVKALLK